MADKKSLLEELPVIKKDTGSGLLDELPVVNSESGSFPVKNANQKSNDYIDPVKRNNYSFAGDVINDILNSRPAKELPRTSISDNISTGMMQYRPPVKANDLNIVDAKKSVKDKFNGDISTLVSFAEKYKDQLAGIPMTRGTNQEQGVVTNMADMLANPMHGTANTFGAAADKPMFDAEKLSNRLANLKGDASAVAPFIDAGVKILNDEKNQKIKQLSATYPMPVAHGIMNDIAPVEQRDPAYEEGVSAINAEYNKKESELRNAANSVVMTKLARERPDLGPEELGMKVREAIGDKTIATSNRLISKGIPLSAAERYASTSLGYQAKNIGKMSAYADGDIAVADKLAKETDDFHNKALNANPEYKQEQIKSAIKEQIYKNKPAYTALTGYSVSQDDFDKAVTQLELDPAELSGLTPEDIQSGASAPRRFMSSFIKNTAEGAYKTAIGGLSRLSGNDEDWTNKALNDHSNWYENSFAGSGYTGENGKLFGDGVKIETARGDNYLENVKDESAKGFNPSFRSVLNTVFDATGQVAANAFGAGVLGGGTKGLVAAIALSQYENNYQQAVQAIGDDPNDQGKRHLYAALNTTATAFAETIMPDSDIVGGILGQGNIAGREFIDLIQREGVDAIRQPATRALIAQGLKESFKQYGKEVSEDVIEQGVNSIVDAFLAPKKFAETDQSEAFKQTVISSAIGSAIPTFSSGMRAPIQKGRLINSMLYEVGSDPKTYIDNINELVEAGQINKAEGDDKIKTIEKMAEIVNKSVPAKSVVNSQPLTDQQKEDYATNLLTENQLQEQREQVKDEVQESVIDAQIQNLQTERAEILNNAGPVIAEDDSSSINNNGNETEKANEAQGQENGLLAPSESSAQGAAPASYYEAGLEEYWKDDGEEGIPEPQVNNIQDAEIEDAKVEEKDQQAIAEIPQQAEVAEGASQSNDLLGSANIAPRAVPTPVNYTTQTGNQTVTSQNGVFKVVNSKTGEEVSRPTARKATMEAAQNYDFTVGDTAALPDVPMSGSTMGTHVAETSTSPIELVDLYTNEEPEGETLSGPESAIVEYGGFSTTNKSYKRFGDKNNMGFSKAKSYINDAKGAGIDQIAQEVTDNTGIQVEPQDIVEFMDRFPNGVAQAMKTKPSPVAEKAAKRFQEITGFPLTADIADEVRKQADAKADQQEKQFINKDYESRLEIETEFWDQFARELLADESEESIVSQLEQAGENVAATNQGQATDTGSSAGAVQETDGSNQSPEGNISAGDDSGSLSIDDRLLAMRDEIGAMRDKLERSVAARDLLQKQGKANTPEYQVKFKGAQQLNQKLKTLQREYEKMSSKAWAEILRSKKIKNPDLVLSSPAQIPVAIYNAALELAASALEGGVHLKVAIEQAIDFIKDRVHGKWDENKMRNDILGEDMSVPLNPEEIRARKISDGQLSAKQQKNADAIVSAIKQNKSTLTEAEQYINSHKDITPDTKAKVISYLRSTVSRDVFKATAMIEAQDYISNADGDYNEALRQLQLDYAQNTLNNTDEKLLENLRAQYVATKTEIQVRQDVAGVTNGTIKPVSVTDRALPEAEGGFVMPEQKVGSKRRQELVNKYERLEEAQKNSTSAITQELDATSGYRLMGERAAHKVDEIKQYLGDTGKKKGSFFDRLYKAGLDIQGFALYLYAKHAPERNARNAEQREARYTAKLYELEQRLSDAQSEEAAGEIQSNIDKIRAGKDSNYVLMPDGGSGMTNTQSEEILAEIEANGETEKYDHFGQDFRENVIDKILDFKHEARLLKDQEYEDLSSTYSHYVPLKFDLDVVLGADGSKSLAETGKTGRDLFRSTGAADIGPESRNNVILQTISDLEYSIYQGEENLANIRMSNLIEANPNEDIWETVPARYDVLRDKNGNVVDAVEVFKPQGKGVIPYWVDGNKRYIVLRDKGLQETFKKIKPTLVMRALQKTTGFVRNFATMKNVPFILINPLLDLQDAAVYLKGQDNPKIYKSFKSNAKSFFPAAKGILKGTGEWGELYKDWAEVGGPVSFARKETIEEAGRKSIKNFEAYKEEFSKEKLSASYKALKNVVNEYTGVLELATRLLVYKSGIDAGLTKEQAAIHSREATIDFAKSGTMGPYINSWKAFANASVQGLNKDFRLLKSKAALKVFSGMIAFGMAQAFFADMFSDCENDPDTCYWEMPEYRKTKNIIVATGVSTPVTIPVGRSLGWFNYLGQNIYSLGKYISTKGEQGTSPADFTANTVTSLFDYYNPAGGTAPIMQQLLGNAAPAVGLYANENNFGQQIKPDNKTEKPESENYFPKTPEAYKDISHFLAAHTGGGNGETGAIEISPNDLEYIVQSTLSGTYGWMKGVATSVSKGVSSDEDVKAKDVPLLNRFYRESNLSGTKTKLQGLVDDASKREFTGDEMEKIETYIARLKANNELTDEQAESRMKYVNKTQKKLIKSKNKHAEEDSAAEE